MCTLGVADHPVAAGHSEVRLCPQTDAQPGFPADTPCEHTEMKVTGVNSRVGMTFGKYKITGLLGKGGMGEVYQAYDTAKGRTVALKILSDQFSQDETFRTRFLRESHAAAILQEPHVIPIHDWGEIDGSMYIDMRLVQGQTLYDLIKRGPLEPARAVSIISQIASALDAAHDERLIHRDVKPQNIIVTPADFGYLVDFGIAEAKGDTRLTMTGTHIGSMAYMAPERFLDQAVTAAVDVYALACVLYEALTARPPFPSDSMEQVIAGHMSSPPPRPSLVNPHVPASLDEVIARGMAKDPDDRYGSAGALGRAAQKALKADRLASPGAATIVGPQTVSSSSGQTWLPRPMTPPTEPAMPPRQYDPLAMAPTQIPSTQMPHTQTPRPPDGGRRSGQWVMPTVIAVVAVLLLGGIGVVIGLLAQPAQNAGPAPTSAVPERTTEKTTSSSNSSAPPPPTSTALPPLVTGPDNSASHESCDQGESVPNQSGWGSRSGRGTPETSCYFASSVLKSYWAQFGRPTRDLRTVSAPGAVGCNTVAGARCDPANTANFLMDCAAYGSDNWVTCTGGSNARVYLY
jgi:serine/threonine kinase PknH